MPREPSVLGPASDGHRDRRCRPQRRWRPGPRGVLDTLRRPGTIPSDPDRAARGRRLYRRDVVAPTAEAEPTRADRRDQAGRSRRRRGCRSRDGAARRRSRRTDVSQHRSRKLRQCPPRSAGARAASTRWSITQATAKRDLSSCAHPAGDPQERSWSCPTSGAPWYLLPSRPDRGIARRRDPPELAVPLGCVVLPGLPITRARMGPDACSGRSRRRRTPIARRAADTCGTTRSRRATATASARPAPR